MSHLRLALAVLALTAPLASAQSLGPVFRVGDASDPSVDFTDLQVAVDTVPDGSTLLLSGKDHTSNDFTTLPDKSLNLVAANPDGLRPIARFLLPSLSSGKSVRVRGLTSGNGAQNVSGLHVEGAAGSVFVEDSELRGTGGTDEPSYLTVTATDAQALHLVRTAVGYGTSYFGTHVTPVTLYGATRAALFDCDLGATCNFSPYGCSTCLSGLLVAEASTAWLIDGTSRGSTCEDLFYPSASGAVKLVGTARVVVRGAELQPGSINGVPVPPIEAAPFATSEILHPGARRGVEAEALVGSGATTTVDLFGAAGDLVFLFRSQGGALLELAEFDSVLSLGAPALLAGPLTLDAQGQLGLAALAPGVPAGFALPLFLQTAHVPSDPGPGAAIVLGAPTSATIL